MVTRDKLRPHQRTWWIVTAVVAVIAVIAVVLLTRDADDAKDKSDNEAAASSSAPPSDIGFDPQASRPVETPEQLASPTGPLPPELKPVAPESTIVTPSGTLITLAHLEAVYGEAAAAGEISGPAVRATVQIENGGTVALDLEYAVVNLYYGDARTPAGTLTQPGGEPFTGQLDPGEDGQATYLFSVPVDQRDNVTITVDYQAGEATAVFQGSLE